MHLGTLRSSVGSRTMRRMNEPEIVDIATARAARGVRMVVVSVLPSPWSEGAKNVFHLAGVQTRWVRVTRDAALAEWTRAHNAPVVFHDDEPPRTGWAEIVTLAARLGTQPIVPSAASDRARHFGWIHELAGEDGLAWSARLLMIDQGLRTEGARGFPTQVAKYLAPKYGYAPERVELARVRIAEVLDMFARELGEREYLAGDAPGAVDVYLATCLAPLVGVTEEACPTIKPEMRNAFDTLRHDPELTVPLALAALRSRMYDKHLPFPIRL